MISLPNHCPPTGFPRRSPPPAPATRASAAREILGPSPDQMAEIGPPQAEDEDRQWPTAPGKREAAHAQASTATPNDGHRRQNGIRGDRRPDRGAKRAKAPLKKSGGCA